MPLLKDIYDTVKKIEQDRIVDTSFIKSYGKIPVNNKKYEKLISYLEKVNKQLQIKNPSQSQIGYQKMIEQQFNLSRLKILNDNLLNTKDNKYYINNINSIISILSFRNWCGLGTPIYKNIEKDLDDPAKMFQIDNICKNHDIAYLKSKTQKDIEKADTDMLYDVFEKYIFNHKKNFRSGNYETDFTNWSSSFNTVLNYFWSLIESAFSAAIIFESVKELGKTTKQIIQTIPKLPGDLYQYYQGISNQERLRNMGVNYKVLSHNGDYRKYGRIYYNKGFATTIKDSFYKISTILISTVITDKFLALITLGFMGIKVGLENFGIVFTVPTEHEVSDQDLNDIISNFELLQNLYLEKSNIKPIKINNKWENYNDNDELTMTDLMGQIDEIIKLNFDFNKTKVELFKKLEPEIPTIEKENNAEIFADEFYKNLKPLTEQKQINSDDFYDKFRNDMNKLIEILLKHNIEQEKQQINDEETEQINDEETEQKNINTTPDIQNDINNNLQNNMPIIDDNKDNDNIDDDINESNNNNNNMKDEL